MLSSLTSSKKIPPPHWPRKSVAHKLTTRVPVLRIKQTLEEAGRYLRENILRFNSIDYLYVTDEKERLVGVFSIKVLYRRNPKTKLGEVDAAQELIYVTPAIDEEEAANLCLRHGLKA